MPGYPSLVVGMMVIGGVQLLMIGVLGEYIGKLLSEIKARPVYFVAEHSVKSADETAKEPQSAAGGLARGGVSGTCRRPAGKSGCARTTTAFPVR